MKVIRLKVTDQGNDKEEIFSLNQSSFESCNLSKYRYFTLSNIFKIALLYQTHFIDYGRLNTKIYVYNVQSLP